jgi:hypothetical protein
VRRISASKIFRVKTGNNKTKFTDPLNLLTLDNPEDEYNVTLNNARYLCYVVSAGEYETYERLWNDAAMDEVWEYYRIKLADSYGKSAISD